MTAYLAWWFGGSLAGMVAGLLVLRYRGLLTVGRRHRVWPVVASGRGHRAGAGEPVGDSHRPNGNVFVARCAREKTSDPAAMVATTGPPRAPGSSTVPARPAVHRRSTGKPPVER